MNYLLINNIPDAAILEGLAEEAAELAQAALKVARVLRRENPTPTTLEAALDHLQEELADVLVYESEAERRGAISLERVEKIANENGRRWISRLEEV